MHANWIPFLQRCLDFCRLATVIALIVAWPGCKKQGPSYRKRLVDPIVPRSSDPSGRPAPKPVQKGPTVYASDTAPLPDRGIPLSTEELIARVDQAFAGVRQELKPGVLIFPLLDGDNRIRHDGAGISQMACYAATYGPEKRLAVSPMHFRNVLVACGCLGPGTAIDADLIKLCTTTAEVELYVVPRVVTQERKRVLQVEFHGNGAAYADRTFEHKIGLHGLIRAPGLIAVDVLSQMGIQLTEEQRQATLEPQVKSERDAGLLSDFVTHLALGDGEWAMLSFLDANPRNIAGWDVYLTQSRNQTRSLTRFAELQPPLEHVRLQISRAIRIREAGFPQEALLELLELAPSHRGDEGYHSTLTRAAIRLNTPAVVDRLFEIWRQEVPGYAGCAHRGDLLVDWGWEARGGGFAGTVTEEGWRLFSDRLERAREELERAVELNPAGLEAHAELERVAVGLALPREYMEEHFQQAVRVRPEFKTAYDHKFQYLQPRWHGSREELFAFGVECLETGLWDTDIPNMFLSALEDCVSRPERRTIDKEFLRRDDVWKALQRYVRDARSDGSESDAYQALDYYVLWGTYGGHADDVAKVFHELQWPAGQIFDDGVTWKLLRDMGRGESSTGPERLFARLRLSLAHGDFVEADKLFSEAEKGKPPPVAVLGPGRSLEDYRRYVELGKRLHAEKRIAFTPEDITRLFRHPLVTWKIKGDTASALLPAGESALMVLPFGFRHGTISGQLDWSPGTVKVGILSHTQSFREVVNLQWFPAARTVQLEQDDEPIFEAPLQPALPKFRIDFGATVDRFQPYPGIRWSAPVQDDAPSGFAFKLDAGGFPVALTIRNLKIELRSVGPQVPVRPDDDLISLFQVPHAHGAIVATR